MDAQKQLELLDSSLKWLFLIVSGVLLSFCATARQREAICLALAGETEKAAAVGEVLPVRRLVALLVLLALTFFFLVSLNVEEHALESGDEAAIRSARLNRWASLFVLSAAVLRFFDVNEARTAEESRL